MRNTKTLTISLPPTQLKQAEQLAKKQNRTMSELFREAFRVYQQEEKQPRSMTDLRAVVQLLQQGAAAQGLDKMPKREINAEIAAVRKAAQKTGRRATTKRPGQ